MTDRAPEVAAFLAGRPIDADDDLDTLLGEIERRWPGLPDDQVDRGIRIATGIMASVVGAAAVANLGEADLRKIAADTGVPLEDVRACVRAMQHGETHSPTDTGHQGTRP